MKIREVLLDAKKAVGVGVATIPAVLAAGFIDNAQAAEITGAFGVVATVLTYVLRNVPKPKPAPLWDGLAP